MGTRLAVCSFALMVTTLGGTAHAGDIAQGKVKAAMCAGCHTLSGIGLTEEYPNLAGQKEAYLVKQLKAFKSRTRTDPTSRPSSAAGKSYPSAQRAASESRKTDTSPVLTADHNASELR